MSRLLASALALLVAAGTSAQEAPKAPAQEAPPKTATEAAPAEKPAPPTLSDLDPKTRAAIQSEIEKMREDIRNEVRAEIQGAQSASEFLGAVAEGPKLEFLELDGYLRFRGQLTANADLGVVDASGFPLYPVPLQGAETGRSTLASANMRLRFEPTLNVSEHVRVRAQVDILDNYVLGSSSNVLMEGPFSPYPAPFWGSTRTDYQNDPRDDRDAISVKRAWAEIQTPVGLLSFGRMPSQWGLGILANAGGGLDGDYGDTVDRIQFAIPPVTTPLGKLSFVPMLDFDAEGVLNVDQRFGAGTGQPFDAESGDDARTYALKIARLDTEDEIRRKLERNEASFNFGAYYNYRTQRWFYPEWFAEGYGELYGDDPVETPKVKRNAYAHVADLWARLLLGRWRFEAEFAGVYGDVDAFDYRPADTTNPTPRFGELLLRQWGGAFQTEYQAIPNKVALGAELGVASGDSAPGFGNQPNRVLRDENGNWTPQPEGSVEGPQFNLTDDHDIRNFRFNPAYQVDLLLWRRILGNVTDAWYVKPTIRWDLFPGLRAEFAVIYSQALRSSSTPSAGTNDAGARALGIEADGMLSYTSGDGFNAWLQYGILQPFAALGRGDIERGHALNVGLGAKF
jgi:uncharacterized protein (TIGR04551 family)